MWKQGVYVAGPLLRLRRFRARREGWRSPEIELELREGELAVLAGGSGSGKTSILLAVDGLIPHEGEIRSETTSAYVPDEVEGYLLTSRVIDEAAFGPENLGLPRQEVWRRASSAIEAVGLGDRMWWRVGSLSIGMKYRLALASALALQPGILLLDNILATIDPPTRRQITSLIEELRQGGIGVIIASYEKKPEGLTPDKVVSLGPEESLWDGGLEAGRSRRAGGGEVLRVRGLSFRYPGGGDVLRGVSFSVRGSEMVAVMGRNGAGKSTLLKLVSGLLKPSSGTILLDGGRPSPGIAAYIHQNPILQLVGRTPREDLEISNLPEEAVRPLGAEYLLDKPTYSLSLGEKRLVAIALGLALRPRLLAVDEPTHGLDRRFTERVGEALVKAAEEGSAILIATHDERFTEAFADRCMVLRGGRIVYEGEPRRGLVE